MCFVPHVPAFQESESSKLLYQIFFKVKEAVSEKNAHPWCPKLLSSLFTKTVLNLLVASPGLLTINYDKYSKPHVKNA